MRHSNELVDSGSVLHGFSSFGLDSATAAKKQRDRRRRGGPHRRLWRSCLRGSPTPQARSQLPVGGAVLAPGQDEARSPHRRQVRAGRPRHARDESSSSISIRPRTTAPARESWRGRSRASGAPPSAIRRSSGLKGAFHCSRPAAPFSKSPRPTSPRSPTLLPMAPTPGGSARRPSAPHPKAAAACSP